MRKRSLTACTTTSKPGTVIEIGDQVRIVGQRGQYKVVRMDNSDGSYLLWGGDKNPNGKQGYRSIKPDRLRKV